MRSSNRTLAFVLLLSIAGVVALGLMAQRYSRLLEEPPGDEAGAALQRVDRFITVRRGMRGDLDRHAASGGRLSLTVTRDRALAVHGVSRTEYTELRELYRRWRSGEQPEDRDVAAALERRRDELVRLDLGDYESLDR